ncbi:MAG: transcriptional regulator, partial [Lachnospiraceae bacterium]|nr:transcriptional regulator [Lachnospiraceae bacterium]
METKEILLELRTKHALSQDELAEKLCGMPLDDSSISKEPDGSFNEEYCKW